MLTLMRGLLRSKLGMIIFGIVILAMAGWGLTDVFSGGLGNNLIAAGERRVSEQQFDAVVERELRTATDDRGRSISKAQALEQGLIDQIFSREQTITALRAYADKIGVGATQSQIRETIRSIPAFRDTQDVFDPTLLRSYLRQEGFSQKGFEEQLGADLTIDLLRQLPGAGLTVPAALARSEAAYNAELRTAAWFLLEQANLPEIDEPTEEQIQELYDQREQALRIPERRKVSLLRISPDDFTASSVVPDEDVRAFYEAYKPERYTGPDTRTITEFQFRDEASARASLGLIAGGASPSQIPDLAASDQRTGFKSDVLSNQRMADLVFARRSLPGTPFGPLEIDGLWVVVRLEDVIPGEATPFEDVREDIFSELAREQATAVYYERLPRIDDLIGAGATLEDMASDIGVPLLSFDGIDQRGGAETGSFYGTLIEGEGLLEQLFSLPEGSTTERLGFDEITWIGRVDLIEPERLPELDEVRDLLELAWKQQEQFNQLQTVSDEISAAIEAGTSTLAQQAAQYGSEVEALDRPISRNQANAPLPPQLIESLFRIQNVDGLVSLPLGAETRLILQVTGIDRPEPETLDLLTGQEAISLKSALEEDLFQAYFSAVQQEIELDINQSAYAAYKARIDTDQ